MIDFETLFDFFSEDSMSEPDYFILYINTNSNETLLLPGDMHPDKADGFDDVKAMKKRIKTEPGWVKLPEKSDLTMGNQLPLRFANYHLEPEDCDQVHDFFHHSGAYRNFRGLLDRLNKTDEWYKFEENAMREALKEWLRHKKIEFSE